MRRSRSAALLVAMCAAVAAMVMMLAPSRSVAHSSLVFSTPVGGEEVGVLDEIILEFGDAVIDDEFLRVRLETPTGVNIAIGDPELVDARTIRAAGPDQLVAGTYFVRYAATSIDGDLVEGGFLFDFAPASDSGGRASWILLGIGLVSVLGVLMLLRPRGTDRSPVDPSMKA